MRLLAAIALACIAHAAFGAEAAGGPAWAERAETAVQQFVATNAQQLANSILRIARPEGRRAELAGMEVLASADRAEVSLRVAWSGASADRRHLIRVSWQFTPARHLEAKLMGEVLPAEVAARRNAQLDEHFREQIHPAITRAAGRP